MKINFTHNQINYSLCTIEEFAKAIIERLENTEKPGKTQFFADFALTRTQDDGEIDMSNPENIFEEVECWYGIKELGEIGFNSFEDRQVVFDYYSGGRFKSYNINDDDFHNYCYRADMVKEITEVIQEVLNVDENWYILVQWDQDKCLVQDEQEAMRTIQQYEVVEVCPECGAENIMTWNVEKEGYVAYCPRCGSKMMLCDECMNSDDAPICDWSPCNGCFRECEKRSK